MKVCDSLTVLSAQQIMIYDLSELQVIEDIISLAMTMTSYTANCKELSYTSGNCSWTLSYLLRESITETPQPLLCFAT